MYRSDLAAEALVADRHCPSIGELITSIGEDSFDFTFARYLHGLCGADHFAAFCLNTAELHEVAASCINPSHTDRRRIESYVRQNLWRSDPAILQAQQELDRTPQTLVRSNFKDQRYHELRRHLYLPIRDRVLLCGHSSKATGTTVALSLLRSDPLPPFPDEGIQRVQEVADVLIHVLAKHAELCLRQVSAAQALTSLPDIESCILSIACLPRREAQVCARVLYGMATTGIALDLNVSEETVKTYRKRAYQRLNIGSGRELLIWYLRHWSTWTARRKLMQ